MSGIELLSQLRQKLKAGMLVFLETLHFFLFLRIKIENKAEQQMFCGLIRNTCLHLCPVTMHTQMAANCSFDLEIKSRTEGPIMGVNTHQSQ